MSAPISTPAMHKRRKVPRADLSASSSRDASEEDNDMDDAASTISVVTTTATQAQSHGHNLPNSPMKLPVGRRKGPGSSLLHRTGGPEQTDEDGTESATYDGDVDTPVTTAADHHAHNAAGSQLAQDSTKAAGQTLPSPMMHHSTQASVSSNSSLSGAGLDSLQAHLPDVIARMPTPRASRGDLREEDVEMAPPVPPVAISLPRHMLQSHSPGSSSGAASPAQRPDGTPEVLSEDNIKAFVQRAIDGKGELDGVVRDWKMRPPPTDRPVRVYADGSFDLAHYGHALQLRQAKLSFDNVHLLVGVCSDELCAEHKNLPVMTTAERVESVQNIRWVDQVIPDAPWVIDQEWMNRWEIDYVAHDEDAYPSKDHDDVYNFVKSQGRFLPTRRQPLISTSALIERIVRGYRAGQFDEKLAKNGHPELAGGDIDWDSASESAALKKLAHSKRK